MRIRTHTNPFNINQRLKRLDLAEQFKNPAQPLDLEIGFGRGLFLRQYAQQHPERNIIGVDVRKQIVEVLHERLEKLGLENTCILHTRGEICLEDSLEDQSLERVFVFHPDPWFKKKHHKRRVVNPSFLDLVAKKMVPGGRLYLSTDVTLLWEEMESVCHAHPSFESVEDRN